MNNINHNDRGLNNIKLHLDKLAKALIIWAGDFIA